MASATAGGTPERQAGSSMGEVVEEPGYGWIVFAGIIMAIAGVLDFIYGIAAISSSHFYVAHANYVISELNTWGWILVVIGAIQMLVAFGIWAKATWARWTGMGIAGLNAIAELLFLPAYPLLTVSIFALNVLVIYALAVHGRRLEA
jgi:hypothetical protein